MSSFVFVSCLVSCILSQPLYQLPSDLVDELKLDVRARIDTFERSDGNDNYALLPTAVRLAFHDCGGTDLCDGCINHIDPEHGGLEFGAVYPIEQVYQNQQSLTINDPVDGNDFTYSSTDSWTSNPSGIQWSNLIWNQVPYAISRSDFWILFATAALDYGVKIANDIDSTLTPITEWTDACIDSAGNGIVSSDSDAVTCIDELYLYGRSDCSTSPFITSDGFHTNTHWGYHELIRFFNNKWGMTPLNVVALLGVHTLGQGHTVKDRDRMKEGRTCCSGSGFRGAWDISTEIAALDNQYYDWLVRRPHVRKPSNFQRRVDDIGYQNFGSEEQWATVTGTYGAVTSLTNLYLDIDVQLFMEMSNQTQNCNHPRMDELFPATPTPGDQFVDESDDKGSACPRRQIPGLSTGNPWDVFDSDNLAWLYYLQEPWELMTQNNYNYRNNNPPTRSPQVLIGGSISPTKRPTTLDPSANPSNQPTESPNSNGIRLVMASGSGSLTYFYAIYVYNLGCGATIQRVRLTPANGGATTGTFDAATGYYYWESNTEFTLPFTVRISDSTNAAIQVRDIVTDTTAGVEYYMGSDFCTSGSSRHSGASHHTGSNGGKLDSNMIMIYSIIGVVGGALVLFALGVVLHYKYVRKDNNKKKTDEKRMHLLKNEIEFQDSTGNNTDYQIMKE